MEPPPPLALGGLEFSGYRRVGSLTAKRTQESSKAETIVYSGDGV